MAPVAMGVIIFIAVCAFGKNQPHRSFMHSIMAMAILSAAISMVSVKLVLYFVVGFASHLVLDCFNRKRVRILYPLPGGIALDFCKAGGFVDSLLFKLGSVAVIFEIVYLAGQILLSQKRSRFSKYGRSALFNRIKGVPCFNYEYPPDGL